MDVNKILQLITTVATLGENLVGLVKEAKGTLSDKDATRLEEALADMKRRNDAAFNRIDSKLDEAKNK